MPLPHVWWITSGHMGQLPVHAAGDLQMSSSDFAISSYIPTFKALQYARTRKLGYLPQIETRMLIVSMPRTSEKQLLRVTKEVTLVPAKRQKN